MNDYELSKIAELTDEDAMDASDFELAEISDDETASFKNRYLGFYDDIKLTPEDDW